MEILMVQSCTMHVVDDVNQIGVIWPHRLQDYNVLVLKKDAKILLKIHLEVKFDF